MVTPIRIELLFVSDCPHIQHARVLIDETVARLAAPASIIEIPVASLEDAARLGFPGSPTIRVNGQDVEPIAPALIEPTLGCRIYANGHVPDILLLDVAIREAMSR